MNKFFLLALFSCCTIFGQDKIGVFVGLNRASLSDNISDYIPFEGINSSFHIGASYEIALFSKIMFRPEIVYSQQGDRKITKFNDIKDSGPVVLVDYKLSYLNLPLNFKFFKEPALLIGPQIGYLLSSEKLTRDFGELSSKIDYGVNIGGLFEFKNVFFKINFYQGLNRIGDFDIDITAVRIMDNGFNEFEQNISQIRNVKPTNFNFQISIGYTFDKHKLTNLFSNNN